jgi:DNA-binding phage protein
VPRKRVDLSAEDRRMLLGARQAARQADQAAMKARAAYLATIRRLVRRYSSQAAVARALGVSSQRLSQMLKRR